MENITNEQIRKRLIKCIETSGIKKAEICREVGIKTATMAQYKSGRAMPSLETLAKICQYIDESTDYILLGRKDYN